MQGLVQKTQSFAQNVPNFCAKYASKTQSFAQNCSLKSELKAGIKKPGWAGREV